MTTKIIPKSRKTRKGRPSVVESIELDEHIRESAIESFLESGYEAATMARIAKNAGIARQTLYSRYKNKESLFEQVLASAFFQWHEENLDISLEDDVPLESQLIRMANIILDRDLDPRVVKLGRVAIYNIELLQRLLSQNEHIFQKSPRIFAIANLFDHYEKKGVITVSDKMVTAEIFISMVMGIPSRLASFGVFRGKQFEQQRLEEVVRIFVRGISSSSCDDPV